MILFDISDPTNLSGKHSVQIGESGTWSDVLPDHRVLLFSKERNMLAFPVAIDEGMHITFRGAIIYEFDLEEGFTRRGEITHLQEDENPESTFTEWLNRIIYIDDIFITISSGMIKSTDINTMQTVDSLEF